MKHVKDEKYDIINIDHWTKLTIKIYMLKNKELTLIGNLDKIKEEYK